MEVPSEGGTISSSQDQSEEAEDVNDVELDGSSSVPKLKPYFDAHEGCCIEVLPGGTTIKGKLKEGPDGFCLVVFPGEKPFESQVPNLWLQTSADADAAGSKSRLKRPRAKAKAKGKSKAKPAQAKKNHELEEEEAEEEEAE